MTNARDHGKLRRVDLDRRVVRGNAPSPFDETCKLGEQIHVAIRLVWVQVVFVPLCLERQ
jgi:hypothetical protein